MPRNPVSVEELRVRVMKLKNYKTEMQMQI